ncbi:MAG: metalloregulator ArsR/SmtB family transcription factor [Xenococcaceae cyanobacterium MO_188.B19]|nr:metalloregulator ArsR/SmtB family transcription factor [Xenococcaceae cyanobacterium MO_188.B19]
MQATSSFNINSIMAGFQALSDPLRMKIVGSLQEQELCVCDLCELLEVNQSKLSFHLKILKQAGLIIPRQSGRWIYYRLNLVQFALLEEYLAEICSQTKIIVRQSCE